MSGHDHRAVAGEQRRLDALRRLGLASTTQVGELDGFLGLVAALLGAREVSLVVIDQDAAGLFGDLDATGAVDPDGRWGVARRAVEAQDGRASRQVRTGSERASLPAPDVARGADTLAAVAVPGPATARLGALVASWSDPRTVSPSAFSALEAAADHVRILLELRAEVAEYRRFVDLSPQPLVVLDEAGTIELVNPAFQELYGTGAVAELTGSGFLDLVEPDDRARVASQLSRVLFSPRRRLQLDTALLVDCGRWLPVTLAFSDLRGVRRHLQVAVHDLSDRIREEEARTELLEQLARAQRLDAVGQVAGGLAHDLNNLFTVMATNVSLARESLAATEPGRPDDDAAGLAEPARAALAEAGEALSELDTVVARATELTGQLLTFARRRSGGAQVSHLPAVLGGLQRLLRRSLPAQVALEVWLEDDLPPVAADPVQLERAVLNLVNNARDAVGERGSITIAGSVVDSVPPDADGPADRHAGGQAPAVRLTVSDDGIGMDPATRLRAFEPLFTTKAEGRGTGLGLAAVFAFANESDGAVEIASEPTVGTTVTLTLPPASTARPVVTDQPVAGARVLLVEPGGHTRGVIARMLQSAGYRVEAVDSGEQALAHLRERPVDVLVTELVLPGLGGHRLVERARDLRPGLAVVVLSAVDAPRALEGDPVLVKPFAPTRLVRTVALVLRQRPAVG